MEPSVLERQRSRSLQWQQEQQSFSIESFLSLQSEGLGNGWPHLSSIMGEEEEEEEMGAVSVCTSSVPVGKEKSKKKRKAEKSVMELGSNINEAEKKRVKGEGEASGDSSKENSNKKLGYIHVRARRGQATDSHSLAERVRRERISERMKYLQGLVPGCDKITGKAGMLDEIINYVQSLQRQVEFLSMKLATVNPRLDFNMETFFSKEMNMACNSTISTVGMPSELLDPSYLQFNILQQAISCCGLDMAMNQSELDLQRTMSAPVSVPEPFLDSCFNVHRPSSGCDNELQSLYGVEFHQGRGPTFPLQSLQGNLLPNNLKMEM